MALISPKQRMQNYAPWAESGQQIYFVLLKEHLGKTGANIKYWTVAYKHLDFWSVWKQRWLETLALHSHLDTDSGGGADECMSPLDTATLP